MTDELDREHQGRQPPDRPAEMLQVIQQAVLPDAEVVVGHEHRHGQSDGGVPVCRGRLEPRDIRQEIAGEDEQPRRAHERKELAALPAD